jgi:hypothetical protein
MLETFDFVLVAITTILITSLWFYILPSLYSNYQKFKRLSTVIGYFTKDRSTINLIFSGFKFLLLSFHIRFIQYFNDTVKRIDRNNYELTYSIHGMVYKTIIKNNNKSLCVLQVSNEDNNDVTNEVLMYMGPNYDWHGNTFKPEFFGYKSLTFEMSDGTEYTIE